eukprot:1160599-Pelagomonas_calceolata.AAC.16
MHTRSVHEKWASHREPAWGTGMQKNADRWDAKVSMIRPIRPVKCKQCACTQVRRCVSSEQSSDGGGTHTSKRSIQCVRRWGHAS